MCTLYYIHDPMCSWCYGFSRTFLNLKKNLPQNVKVIKLLGGLAPDTDLPMSAEMRIHVQSAWEKIEQSIPGVSFNYQFWSQCRPRRSTYPACRAVIAARLQGSEFDDLMTRSIQLAYYQQARNPSDDSTLVSLAAELALDTERFTADLNSEQVKAILEVEMAQCQVMGVDSYPSLVFEVNQQRWPVEVDYNDYQPMLETILSLSATE